MQTARPEVIKKALKEVKNGGSFRKVAKKYKIEHTVLYRRMKRGQTKKKDGQTALLEYDEKLLFSRIQICSDWGYPIDSITLRLIVKEYINKQGRTVPKFKITMPGPDFVHSFLERNKKELSARMCHNIKRSRAAINEGTINDHFDRLAIELKDIPASNIINYDETNLCDDPGRKVVITRRGCKYPERVMSSTKAAVSVMFAAAGDGTIFPPYVVHKAQHMYDSWRTGGPPNSVKDPNEPTTEESDYSLQDSDADWRESFSEEELFVPVNETSKEKDLSKFALGHFALIKVMGKTKNSFRLYVVKVIEFDEDGYIGKFYKKTSHGYRFLETDDEALFKTPDDVIR